MGKEKDITSERFGEWTALRRAGTSKSGDLLWEARCSCGTEKVVLKKSMTRGKSKSCGCKQKELIAANRTVHRLPKGEASKKQLWHAYKRGAETRGLVFALTLDEFGVLTKDACTYCGVLPAAMNKIPTLNGYYVYNGVDRVNSDIGYIISNCVPCCKRCNYAKRSATVEEFHEWITRLTKFQQEKTK